MQRRDKLGRFASTGARLDKGASKYKKRAAGYADTSAKRGYRAHKAKTKGNLPKYHMLNVSSAKANKRAAQANLRSASYQLRSAKMARKAYRKSTKP